MIDLLLQAVLLIVKALGNFLTVLLLMRFFMQIFRVSFASQLGRFVLQLTDWLVVPLRKVIPSLRGLDLASLLPAYLVQALLVAIALLFYRGLEHMAPETLALLVVSRGLLGVIRLCLYMLIVVLFLQAFLSWVMPHSPLTRPLWQVTEPFLRPIRRIVPTIADIDLSPLIAILAAQVILIFV
jgi:YggT family protein